MKLKMKKVFGVLAVAAVMATTAGAQQSSPAAADAFPSEPYEFILAKLAADDGHYDEAVSLIDKIIAKNPENAVLVYERAMIQVDAGRLDRAEADLRTAVTLRPDFFDAQRVLGRILLDRAGTDRPKVEEALTHLQAAWKINPDDLGSGMAVSQILQSTGRAAEAERVLASLLERAPDQRNLNFAYAQVLTKLGRGDESRKYLERAVEVDPTFGQAIFQLLDIYQKEGEYDKAAEILQPIVAEDPMNLEVQRQQAYFYLRAGQTEKALAEFKSLAAADPKDTRSQFYMAEALDDLERYDEADKIYRTLLEKNPEDAEVLTNYGLSQIGQRKYNEAAKTFRSVLALPELPDNLQVLAKTQLAYIDLQRGNYAAAVDTARPVLVFHDKPNPQAIGVALDALKKEKRYSDAITLLQPIVDKYSSDPYVNARYIEMLLRTGAKEKAAQAAATQAKFGTKNAISAAEAYISADDYPAAIAMIKSEAAAHPDDVDLEFELGSAYERSGDKASAEKVFLAILTQHPDNAATLNYLGYMWADSGVNLDRAAEMLMKAVSQEPRNGAYVDSLGWVYFRKGNLDQAEKYLTDASKLLPNDATVHEHLGDVFARRGDYNRALVMYRLALKLEPETKDEAKLRSKISEVEKQQTAQRR